MVCALEEEVAHTAPDGRSAKVARLKVLKAAASAAMAGLGDAIFWGALRPSCAALALFLALWLKRYGWTQAALGAGAGYLAAYNLPAIALRWRLLRWGYDWKDQIATRLKDWPSQALIKRLRLVGLVLALAAGAFMLRFAPESRRFAGMLALAVYLGLKFAGVPTYRLYAATCVAGFCAALVGWM